MEKETCIADLIFKTIIIVLGVIGVVVFLYKEDQRNTHRTYEN